MDVRYKDCKQGIIFLDFDGVLNSECFQIITHHLRDCSATVNKLSALGCQTQRAELLD